MRLRSVGSDRHSLRKSTPQLPVARAPRSSSTTEFGRRPHSTAWATAPSRAEATAPLERGPWGADHTAGGSSDEAARASSPTPPSTADRATTCRDLVTGMTGRALPIQTWPPCVGGTSTMLLLVPCKHEMAERLSRLTDHCWTAALGSAPSMRERTPCQCGERRRAPSLERLWQSGASEITLGRRHDGSASGRR